MRLDSQHLHFLEGREVLAVRQRQEGAHFPRGGRLVRPAPLALALGRRARWLLRQSALELAGAAGEQLAEGCCEALEGCAAAAEEAD